MRSKVLLFIILLAGVSLASTAGTLAVQGFLTDNNEPVNSTTCRIWVGIIDEADGSIDAQYLYTNVKVEDGIFDLLVDMPELSGLDWNKPYLVRFSVHPSGTGSLTTVLPFQKLYSVPYTFMTRRQHGGTVEAEFLSAENTISPVVSARMGYRGSITDEAVTGYIGSQAVGKLGVEHRMVSGTNYYGAYAEGRDFGIYAESDGNAVVGETNASYDTFAAGLSTTGGIWGTSIGGISARIIGPLKVASPVYTRTSGTIWTPPITILTSPGAKDKVTISHGTTTKRVNNPLVRGGRTMVFLTVQNVFVQHVWVKEMGDGYFILEKESDSGDMQVAYLLVN